MAASESLMPFPSLDMKSFSEIALKPMKNNHRLILCAAVIAFSRLLSAQATAAQQISLQLDPTKSGVDITLVGNLHTVEGTFTSKRGALQYDPATGIASGEIVFDATSGKTGNDSRDKKMHKDVIQSDRYPEITFRPDHAEGVLALSGDATLQVHGQFSIHGSQHEVTFPVQMTVQGNSWTAKALFTIPYAKWGMKNPSVLFFRVGDDVKIQFHASGNIAR
jgi:polyisoprenoid-binding protein YceI